MLNELELLLIGFSVMLLLMASVVFFVVFYQRKLMRYQTEQQRLKHEKQQEIALATIRSEEQERKRIAAELHDDVGANLSAVNLLLSSYTAQNLKENTVNIDEAKNLLNASLQTIRGLSYRIHPSPLQKLGLQSALLSYFNILSLNNHIQYNFEEHKHIPRFDETTELNIYRIIQEFVTNIQKYAKASMVHCSLQYQNSVLKVNIQHDGNGLSLIDFEKELANPKGVGLQNIKHRIEIQNGSYNLFQDSKGLYNINIEVPVIAENKFKH